jgi:hypothetical protein
MSVSSSLQEVDLEKQQDSDFHQIVEKLEQEKDAEAKTANDITVASVSVFLSFIFFPKTDC